MLTQSDNSLDAVFAALAHPTRRAIIEQLSSGNQTVNQLDAPHNATRPAISQHLRVLQEAGLVEQSKDGRLRRCALQAAPLSTAFGWITRYRIFWEAILDHVQQEVEH